MNTLRLAAYPLSFGLLTVFVSGTLNRVMIVELELPASLAALFLAIPLLIAPARVWFGYLSDGYPVYGKRREPYILSGMMLAALGVLVAALLVTNHAVGSLVVSGALIGFLAFGVGSNLSSNTFEALLADQFQGDQRPRIVTLFKVVMFVGLIGGAIGLGRLLDPFSRARFNGVGIGLIGTVALLTVFAIIRQERRSTAAHAISQQAHALPFFVVLRSVVLADPQARRFFILVMLAVMGTLAQDVLLEPYGALVLEMSVAQTTRLTAIWGSGAILAMLAGGLGLIRQIGYAAVLRAGLILTILVFAGIIGAGQVGSIPLFMVLVFLLGLGTGFASAGLLTAVIEFTTFTRAGLLMGVWGVAHELGQAAGGLMGGVVVDGIKHLTGGHHLAAYGTVFTAEALLLLVALGLSVTMRLPSIEASTEASIKRQEWAGETA